MNRQAVMSPIRWWARHPWLVWWGITLLCPLPTIVMIVLATDNTLFLSVVVFLLTAWGFAWIASLIQGVIVTGRRSKIRAVLAVVALLVAFGLWKQTVPMIFHMRDRSPTVTPLMIAASRGRADTVKDLIEKGADVNERDKRYGMTALMSASLSGHTDIVKFLIDRGADVNGKDGDGTTPLIKAAMNRRFDTVRLLLNRGADVNAKDKYGRSALREAARKGYTDIVKLLLDANVDVNMRDKDNKTALRHAEEKDHTETIELLRRAGGEK